MTLADLYRNAVTLLASVDCLHDWIVVQGNCPCAGGGDSSKRKKDNRLSWLQQVKRDDEDIIFIVAALAEAGVL